jgi:uncharacterized protein (TIGR01777 family)
MKNVLITGGTGLIGRELTKQLLAQGYNVSHLSRTKSKNDAVRTFVWDLDKKQIEPAAFADLDIIIHLAGSGIADGRWTEKRKEEILRSRVDACNLLFEQVKAHQVNLKLFISASGVGYYGAITSVHVFEETDPPASDFLGKTCLLWEQAADQFKTLNARVVKIRTGIVLSNKGGALQKMAAPIKLCLGAPIGSGNQFMPWIHISDLVNIYSKAIAENTIDGSYNAVAPEHIINKQFNSLIASYLKKPLFLPPIPGSILKLFLGEMAKLVLEGSRVSSKKIEQTGFIFQYPSLKEAIKQLL